MLGGCHLFPKKVQRKIFFTSLFEACDSSKNDFTLQTTPKTPSVVPDNNITPFLRNDVVTQLCDGL